MADDTPRRDAIEARVITVSREALRADLAEMELRLERHIADAVGAEVRARGMRKVGLLGTHFTMEQPFYRDRLAAHGFDVVVPRREQRELVHRVIFDELVRGVIRESSRDAYAQIIADLSADGAEGVILGCTEITLLVGPQDAPIPRSA